MTDTANWPKGFMVVQGNRMEDLCDTYVQWLKRYPLGPLESDLILAQSNGIAQWLKQTLAVDEADGGLGIAAGIDTMLPAQFVWQSYCAVLPGLSKQSVYNKQALTWRIYRLLGEWQLDQLAPMLSAYVSAESTAMDRLQLARQLADLYDQYQVFRADWLQAWEQGKDCLLDHGGMAIDMPDRYVWQAELWRLICADIRSCPAPDGWSDANRGQLHERFLQASSVIQQSPLGMPRRVVVFGMSSLPMACLEVLKAIAPFTQVLLFVMNPSEYYWGDMVEGRELLQRHYGRQAKRQDMQALGAEELHMYGNPLLASWGKQGRDFLHQFDAWDEPQSYAQYFTNLPFGKVDIFRSPTDSSDSLLAQLQDDILQLRSAEERQALNGDGSDGDLLADASLEFISAHSTQREVEILHDRLLDDFANDETGELQPKDILIMVPDITAYAPHIEAVFGRYRKLGDEPNDSRYLPYHIADTGDRYANPLLAAFETLLSLPTQRMTSVQGLALLEVPACRQQFGIAEEDLHQLNLWIEGANIRWALSDAHRQDLGLPGQHGHNTWQFGIDRLLLGYATGSADVWQGIAGHGEVSGLSAELLGRLSAFVQALEHWRQVLQQAQTASQWASTLSDLWQCFFDANDEQVERLYARIAQYLQEWLDTVEQGQLQADALTLELVQDALYERLDQPNLSSRFMSGAVNFATLMPMRAVPFKQIWLLGMNDGVYPRQRSFNDFDLIGQHYRPGDRSRREDDRYLFLEALLSARDKLVISWQGRSSKDDSEQPPSVLVSQLRDYLSKAFGPELLDQQTQQYPLQPFGAEYFAADKALFTYAKEWQQVAKQTSNNDKLSQLPAWLPERAISSKDLVGLLKSPVDALYQQRLQISKPMEANETPQAESFNLQGLQAWQLSEGVISRHFDLQSSPSDVDQMLRQQAEFWQLSGSLLDGPAGQIQAQPQLEALGDLHQQWQALVQASNATPASYVLDREFMLAKGGEEQALAVEIHLPQLAIDHHLQQSQQVLLQASKAKKDKKDKSFQWRNLCLAWVQHLAAHLYCGHGVSTYLLTPEGSAKFKPLELEQAQSNWQDLLSVWLEAMHEPLPIALNIGIAVVNPKSKNGPTAKMFADDLQYHGHYLQRHFPTWEDIDQAQLEALAQRLYAGMCECVEEVK